jgi:hypothetical protein
MTRLQALRHRLGHAAHWAHEPSHLLYLGAVAWEAHGVYGMAAAACLVISLASHLMGYEGPSIVE